MHVSLRYFTFAWVLSLAFHMGVLSFAASLRPDISLPFSGASIGASAYSGNNSLVCVLPNSATGAVSDTMPSLGDRSASFQLSSFPLSVEKSMLTDNGYRAVTPFREKTKSVAVYRPSTVDNSSKKHSDGGTVVANIAEQTAAPVANTSSFESYKALLFSWLSKHKQYPAVAQRLGIEGEGLLYVRISRTGEVTSHRLERSSDNNLLDTEIVALVKRASPVPPFPADVEMLEAEFLVPVTFRIQ